MYGKRKYESAGMENASTVQTFSQIKKFGTSQLSVLHFKVGGKVDYRLFFSEIT